MGDEKPMSASTGAIKKKKDEKIRRRDQRSWENLIKSMTNMSEGEKISVIQEKYTDVYNELRKASSSLQVMERQCTSLQKERDHTQAELTKHILAKAKLESLCRELQKQNKIIKDENITRVKEEEERRREVATSFTEKLNLLTTLMDENKDKSVRLREENMSMTTKLTELYDQFQEREGHLANMNRQLELQKKLSETQIKKLEVEYQSERQVWEKERQMLLKNLEKSDQTNAVLQENIKSMQEHLDIYKSQYSDFETTMQKSNKVFDAFKEEMTKMQKANTKLEKERNEYFKRWQSCTNSVLQVSEIQQQTSAELKVAERKVQMLEKLCRQLQLERSAYLQQLEEHKIRPATPMPQQEEKPPVSSASSTSVLASLTSVPSPATVQKKLTKKEKLLVALKTELKVMEDELKISTKQQEASKESIESVVEEPSAIEEELPAAAPAVEIDSVSLAEAGEESMISEDRTSTLELSSLISDEMLVKKTKSCPILLKGYDEDEDEESSNESTLDALLTELSLDAIPLYKPEGVTDLTSQREIESLVVEAEARTNLLEPIKPVKELPSNSGKDTSTAEETDNEGMTSEAVTSVETIPLKEAEGKTEIN